MCSALDTSTVLPKFGFGSPFSANVGYKRYTLYPAPFRGVDFFASNLNQPRPACKGCFPQPLSSNRTDYVDLFEFSQFGGMPYPMAPNASPPNRFASDLRYTWCTPIRHNYPSVREQVLTGSRVISLVESEAERNKMSVSEVRSKAARFFFEIRASLNRFVCRICGYLLFKVFRRLMKRLLVNPAQMKALQDAEESGVPLVYLPLHRSHLDYLLITWCSWHFGLRLPHIASGDNLNLSGFGWLLRATGAFFIRRRLDATDEGGKDVVYRTVLRSYLEQLLRENLSIEFFLEGTRSRFGKPLLPKNGLISNVVEAVQQGVIADVYLVPVSYTYDQVAEGVFLNELMGIPKQRESLWGVFKGVWKGFGLPGRCGTVRIHYGKPVLLTEYLSALSTSLSQHSDAQLAKQLCRMPHSFSYRELVPWSQAQKSVESNRALIRSIGYHVVYEAQEECSISPISVVASLLVCKYRFGTEWGQLAADAQWLVEEIISQGGEVVGWRDRETSGSSLVEYAVSYLCDSICRTQDKVEPLRTHRQLIHLSYSKNALVPRFAIRSALGMSIASWSPDEPMTVCKVVDRAMHICDWMQNEAIFCKPCESLRERLTASLCESGLGHCLSGLVRIDRDDFRGDGDGNRDFVEVESYEKADQLVFYSNFLRPFMQTLYLVLYRLNHDKEALKESTFVRQLIVQTLAKAPRELPFDLLLESVNSDSIRNCLQVIREKEFISKAGEPVTVLRPSSIETSLREVETLLRVY